MNGIPFAVYGRGGGGRITSGDLTYRRNSRTQASSALAKCGPQTAIYYGSRTEKKAATLAAMSSTAPRICRGCPSIVSVDGHGQSQYKVRLQAVEPVRTPLFQESQKFVMARSKPTLNANAPTKMVGTKTPAGRDGQPCCGTPTVPLRGHSLLRLTIVL